MYLFRALNEFDIASNPKKNGLASKQMLFDITKAHYEKIEEYNKIKSKFEQEKFIKDHILDYMNLCNNKLEKKYRRYNKSLMDAVYIESNLVLQDSENFKKIIYALSTLNAHLMIKRGKDTYTKWISFSKKLSCTYKYYNSQENHKLAIVESHTNGLSDVDTLAVDLSSSEAIRENNSLLNKIDVKDYEKYKDKDLYDFIGDLVNTTPKGFMGYNFSIADKQVCYYNYVSSDRVKAILESLQVDLLRCGLFDEKYLSLSEKEQNIEYKKLLLNLKTFVNLINDSQMMYVFNELYLGNNNIKKIEDKLEPEKIEYQKKKILGLAKELNNAQIKH